MLVEVDKDGVVVSEDRQQGQQCLESTFQLHIIETWCSARLRSLGVTTTVS